MNTYSTDQIIKRGVLATVISMSLFLTACGGGGGGSTPPPVYNGPGLVATPSTITIVEGGSTTFDVVLNTEPTADVTLAIASADSSEAITSVADLVFTNSTGATPWNVPQTITVSGIVDNAVDGNQDINVVLSVSATTDTDYSALAPTNVATTISDIDAAGVTVTGSTLATSENGLMASFDVQLNTIPDGVVTINVNSTDTTEGDVSSGVLLFDANNWNITQTVMVIPAVDSMVDGNQTYNILLGIDLPSTTDTTGYGDLAFSPISVTNADIDTAGFTVSTTTLSTSENGASANYSVVLNTAPNADVVVDVVSVDITEGTVSPASLTFNASNWNTPQGVVVIPADDMIVDGPQTYNVTMAVSTSDTTGYGGISLLPVAVTNSDDDTAGVTVSTATIATSEIGPVATFDVVLNTVPDGYVTVDVASSDPSEGNIDPLSLTFTAINWSTPQSVTIHPNDDAVADGNQTYNITLTINGVSTTDTTGYAALLIPSVAVTNADNDIAGVTVSSSTLNTSEAGTTASFTTVLNTQPAGDVVITVESSNIGEGSAFPFTLTFNPATWSTPQAVTVTPIDDLMADGNQTYNVTMTVSASTTDTSGYTALTLAPIAVTNADDDTAGFTVSAATLGTSENGTTQTYTVVLNTMPDGNVEVDIASTNTGEGTVFPAKLAFTNADWETPQIITVTPVDDFVVDGNQTYDVTMAIDGVNTLDTTGYTALTLTPVVVTNADDDTAGFTVSALSLTTIENGAPIIYDIVLNTQPDGEVVLNLSTLDSVTWGVSDEVTATPSSLTFTSVDWSTPQTVTVAPQDDLVVDGSVTDWIVTTIDTINTIDTTGYALLSSHWLSATNNDDDVGEGTATNPVVLTLGVDLPRNGGVDALNSSYYQITGLTPGVSYVFSLTGMTDNVDLFVLKDSAYSNLACFSMQAGLADDTCTTTLSGNTLWVKADGNNTASAATYTLNVTRAPLVPNYSSSNTPLALADNGTITDTLTATGAPASLTQVEVLVDLTHTYDSDLIITLISPAGTRVILSDSNGANLDNYTNTTFSVAAATSILAGSAPFSGWYLPQDDIALLNGEGGNGTWSLEITDQWTADTGELLNWGLKLQ